MLFAITNCEVTKPLMKTFHSFNEEKERKFYGGVNGFCAGAQPINRAKIAKCKGRARVPM